MENSAYNGEALTANKVTEGNAVGSRGARYAAVRSSDISSFDPVTTEGLST